MSTYPPIFTLLRECLKLIFTMLYNRLGSGDKVAQSLVLNQEARHCLRPSWFTYAVKLKRLRSWLENCLPLRNAVMYV